MDIIRNVFTLEGDHAGLFKLIKIKDIYMWDYIDHSMHKENKNYIRLDVDINHMTCIFEFEEWHLEDR